MKHRITESEVASIAKGQQIEVVQDALAFYHNHEDKDSHFIINEGYTKLLDGVGETQRKGKSGSALETLIALSLIKEGIRPFYTQAEVAFVHNAKYDIFLYGNDRTLITLSLKTSFRERWKQADLEAFALSQVYKKCLSLCATFNSNEANVIKNKISAGKVFGLHHCFDLSDQNDVNKLLNMLKAANPVEAPEQLGPLLTRKVKV